jgi:3-deoxy-manno-octulosonate cytidylyltransferase (CMP-KDO synthetase)
MHRVAIVIPSRLDSVRLPRKPLAKIDNLTIIEHVVIAAKQSRIESIYVATDSEDIANLAQLQGAKAIITNQECQSGTDRVFLATQLAALPHEVIINLQGDMPFVDHETIDQVALMSLNENYDITTAVAVAGQEYAQSKSNVKAIVDKFGRALYFSRGMIPYNADRYLCHIGIYGFKRAVLQKFCSLPPSSLERFESLEQLRALENGMTIGACIVKDMPISVDTQIDLDDAIKYALSKNN